MEDDWDKWKIIGVVDDYRHESVKKQVYPAIFRLHRNKGQMVYYSVLSRPGSKPSAAVAAIGKAWKQTWPEKPFDYFFLDSYYDMQYKSEIYFSRIFACFATVAGLIACLGILGMTLFESAARTKEISIRKVLGASVVNLITMLSRSNMITIGISSLIAIPAIYIFALTWLSGYPVQMHLQWWYFAAPVAAMVLLVLISSGRQILNAANTDPAKNLKEE